MAFKSSFSSLSFLLFLLISIHGAYSIGVVPALGNAEYVLNTPQTYRFQVLGYPGEPTLKLSGDLAPYVTDKKIVLEGDAWFAYVTLNLNSTLTPGKHQVVVLLGEGGGAVQGATMSAKAQIGAPIVVWAFSDSKFLVFHKFDWVRNAHLNVKGDYNVHVENLGRESINSVTGNLLITSDADANFKREIPLSSVTNLGFRQSAELKADWTPGEGIPFGVYGVQPILQWDGNTLEVEKYGFIFGDMVLNLTDLLPREFQVDTISAALLSVQSFWSSPVDYTLSGSIKTRDGKEVSKLSSSSGTAKLFTTDKSTMYIDTHNIPVGEYDLYLQLNYDKNKGGNFTFPIKVLAEKPAAVLDAGTIPVTETETVSSSYTWYIVAGIVVVLLIVFFIYKRRKDEAEEV